MSDHDVVGYGLSAYFRAIQARAHELIEPLSTQELWIRSHSYGNSVGNLVLHLADSCRSCQGTLGPDHLFAKGIAGPKRAIKRGPGRANAKIRITGIFAMSDNRYYVKCAAVPNHLEGWLVQVACTRA